MKKIMTIARKKDLTDYDGLRKHPKVVRALDLPYDYVLFEFWDDAFVRLYDRDKPYHQYPELVMKARELEQEQEALIKPLISRATQENFVSGFGFLLNENEYIMAVLRRGRPIETCGGKADPISRGCSAIVYFNEIDEKRKKPFEKVLGDWTKWGTELSYVIKCELPIYKDKKATLRINFSEKFEDALAALIIMLNHTRLKTGVIKVNY